MKLYLISDNIDTQVGMRLAGIEGVVVHDPEALHDAVSSVMEDKSIGILIFTEKAAAIDEPYVRNLKLTLHTPLIVEIPDRHGSRNIGNSINSMVSESIGLKL
mgnify:FL=1|jgi:V/A-type H+-transporting ATPase subunit F